MTTPQYYTSGASEQSFNASFPQWTAQGPRSVGQPAPSPSLSMRTTRSAPNPRSSAHAAGNFNSQPVNFQRDNRIDPNLSNLGLLTVPNAPFHAQAMDNANPIARFYSEDMPWSSESRRNRNVSFERTANDGFAYSHSQPNMFSYREGPGSEAESLTAPRTDSGYHTIPPQSLVGHDPEPDTGFDVTRQVGNISVSESGDMFGPRSMTDAASVISGRSATRSHGREITCPECKEVSKCQSDHKCASPPVPFPQSLALIIPDPESICCGTTNPSNARFQTAAELVVASPPSTTLTGTGRASIALAQPRTHSSAPPRRAGAKRKFGRVSTTSNSTSTACTKTRTKMSLLKGNDGHF